MLPRPQSFGAKLLTLFVLVVGAAQLATWLIVSTAHNRQARQLIQEELTRAAVTFARNVKERNDVVAAAGATAVRDYAFKQLFAGDEIDVATLGSYLPNFLISTKSDVVAVLALDGQMLVSTSSAFEEGGIYAQLAARADADANSTATGYGYLGGELYSFVVAAVRTPDIVAWLVIGFHIDREYAHMLRELTGVEVTFLDHTGRLLATTLSPATARALGPETPRLSESRMIMAVPLAGETALIATRRLAAGEQRWATLALQYSLDEKLKPARFVENVMLGVLVGSLALAVLVSRAFARRLSRPIEQLAEHTRVIAHGDYRTPLTLQRTDELGRLADSFRAMSAGLEERDLMRDLLDKNVSPEVAAKLIRDGAALGGQLREVTILFSDIRGFTTLSEKLSAPEIVALLNRYFDRMHGEIVAQGGVIDKFIGDSVMALFGAPLDQPDSADRAVAAALAMERALVAFNAELAAEGHSPLGIGIGINTARVVAGNIGSQKRLNYSVIGDGVNIAARLQTLTRTPEYRTNIVVSEATLAALRRPEQVTTRRLGSVQVKGRAGALEIFAVTP